MLDPPSQKKNQSINPTSPTPTWYLSTLLGITTKGKVRQHKHNPFICTGSLFSFLLLLTLSIYILISLWFAPLFLELSVLVFTIKEKSNTVFCLGWMLILSLSNILSVIFSLFISLSLFPVLKFPLFLSYRLSFPLCPTLLFVFSLCNFFLI